MIPMSLRDIYCSMLAYDMKAFSVGGVEAG